MREKRYPSDLEDGEWALIEAYIPQAQPGGRPNEYARREIVNGMLYVLRTGCGWEYLPHDFPPWKTVYYYFRQWKQEGIWEEANAAVTEQSRVREGREPSPSLAIIDSQSAQTTEKGGSKALTIIKRLKDASATSSSTCVGICWP